MERKIGEIFEYNGEWYQCVEGGIYCPDCVFFRKKCNSQVLGECAALKRSDKENVIFKKLEKVGKPYEYGGHIFQEYHVFEEPIFTENYATIREFGVNSKLSIEIKQTKEDMEEKKLNLKPFDIQKAREGKPVCTRDGRKARIICFDAKFPKTGNIVTLVEKENGEEVTLYHYDDGHCSIGRAYDLMMLPEKKEGWVNLYKSKDTIFKSEKEAKAHSDDFENYIATVKIEWEE